MGLMLVAFIVVLFLAFAAASLCIGAVIALRLTLEKSCPILGLYILGSGFLGAGAAVLFGLLQRWNVVGDAIMAQPLLGYPAWAAIGFGWSTTAAFIVGSLFRKLLRMNAG
jgi:hypothetical protein